MWHMAEHTTALQLAVDSNTAALDALHGVHDKACSQLNATLARTTALKSKVGIVLLLAHKHTAAHKAPTTMVFCSSPRQLQQSRHRRQNRCSSSLLS